MKLFSTVIPFLFFHLVGATADDTDSHTPQALAQQKQRNVISKYTGVRKSSKKTRSDQDLNKGGGTVAHGINALAGIRNLKATNKEVKAKTTEDKKKQIVKTGTGNKKEAGTKKDAGGATPKKGRSKKNGNDINYNDDGNNDDVSNDDGNIYNENDGDGPYYNETIVDPTPRSCSSLRRDLLESNLLEGFVFWSRYDSPGSDIGKYDNVNLDSMITSCANDPKCKGFVTTGWYKSYIQPLRNWSPLPSVPSCEEGLYIKKPTTFKINGHALTANEQRYMKWIAKWTVPYFGMSRYSAIRDYIAKGAWWSLREMVLYESNPFNYNNCHIKETNKDKIIGPLTICQPGMAWQVGIAAVQVPNYSLQAVEDRAASVYGMSIPTLLGRSAAQAGYSPGTATYTAITRATGDLRKAWLLKLHLVGFYFVRKEVDGECLIWPPKRWCYDGACIRCGWFSPTANSIQRMIDEVMVMIQSLVEDTYETINGGCLREYARTSANTIVANNNACVKSFNTYAEINPASDHTLCKAVDIWPNTVRASCNTDVAEYIMNNQASLKVKYVIYGQRKWNPSIDKVTGWSMWRPMEDRGGDTANHWDHIHVSFL